MTPALSCPLTLDPGACAADCPSSFHARALLAFLSLAAGTHIRDLPRREPWTRASSCTDVGRAQLRTGLHILVCMPYATLTSCILFHFLLCSLSCSLGRTDNAGVLISHTPEFDGCPFDCRRSRHYGGSRHSSMASYRRRGLCCMVPAVTRALCCAAAGRPSQFIDSPRHARPTH